MSSIENLGSEGNSSENKEENTFNLLDINPLKESLKLINNGLDKGCSNGSYNLDEAYLLKVSCNNISQAITHLEDCHRLLLEAYKKANGSSQVTTGKKLTDPTAKSKAENLAVSKTKSI